MNNGYFTAGSFGGGMMMSADVTPFHPSMLLEHFGFGLGLGGAPTATDMAAQIAASNVTLASFAGQPFAAAPTVLPPQSDRHGTSKPPEEEMDDEYGVAGAGDSCGAASLQCPGQSGAMAVWPSSSKTPYGSWNSADRSRTVSVCEPYLAGIPDAAGFHYPLAAWVGGGGVPNAPARSGLSLTLCSKSSSDSALNAAGDQQSSSAASRSALTTELPYAVPARFDEVVARSRYAAVAQEVLNDIVCRLLDGVADSGSGGATPLSWSVDASSVVSSNRLMASSEDGAGARWGQARPARSDLVKMLQMLDEKYNQCLDDVQSTTAKFNALIQQGSVGVGNTSICAPFAHRAVSAMYRGLRRRIEIMAAAASRPTCWGESSSSVTAGEQNRSWEAALIQKHWAAQQLRRGEQQCWRPQRGLPERSVAVLKAWMFEHFLKPYPDDHDKDMLAARSGLTRSQVSNWFINARVRIWKPMIEEMYKDLKRGSTGEQGMEMEPQQSNMLSA
ncbi:hypothetical protein EJB05_24927, partial [Eragrostis curvula]